MASRRRRAAPRFRNPSDARTRAARPRAMATLARRAQPPRAPQLTQEVREAIRARPITVVLLTTVTAVSLGYLFGRARSTTITVASL